MKKEKINRRKAGRSLSIVFGITITIMLIVFSMPKPVLVENEETETWHVIWKGTLAEAAEGDPGSGASGFLEIFYINHSGTPATAYTENSSATLESWCTAGYGYASADNFKIQLSSAITFDLLGRFRFNKTHAYETDKFIDTDCRVNITHTGLNGNAISDVTGTLVVSHNDSSDEYLWANVYWNNAAAGYTIAAGGLAASNQCTEISIEAKY